jgi:hypothetical protein
MDRAAHKDAKGELVQPADCPPPENVADICEDEDDEECLPGCPR